MAIQEEIVGVLRRAEGQLTSRLREALEDRQYSDVVELASASRQVHELIQSLSRNGRNRDVGVASQAEPVGRSAALDQVPAQPAKNARDEREGAYPKFARAGEGLVKIGWSKRSRAEYEHRAPEVVVLAVVSALRDMGSSQFTMAELTPVRDEDGTEVPSYQVYLVVAWLRTCGAVRKAGRGAYVASPERLSVGAVKEHWVALEEARASEGESD